jgi:hypothetical protein
VLEAEQRGTETQLPSIQQEVGRLGAEVGRLADAIAATGGTPTLLEAA